MKYLLGIFLMVAHCAPALAKKPVIGVSQTINDSRLKACTQIVYQSLLIHQQQHYAILPNWYMQQMTQGLVAKDQELFKNTFAQLQDLNELIVLRLSNERVSALWLGIEREKNPNTIQVLKSETLSYQTDLTETCTKLALKIQSIDAQERFRSPLLSAGLSFLIPGAGHYYRNSAEGVALGTLFLASYITITYLAVTNTTSLERSQWGGILLGLSLTDILSAYYLTSARKPY